MQTYTPVRTSSTAQYIEASDALTQLDQTATLLFKELKHLPTPGQAMLDALQAKDHAQVTLLLVDLIKALDHYWQAPSALEQSRTTLFAARLKRALRDEATLKEYEGELQPEAKQCLADAESPTAPDSVISHALSVQLNEQSLAEIKGALVMSTASGRTLLALPGSGLTEHTSHATMRKTLANWLNDETQRWTVLANTDLRHQAAIRAVTSDSDLSLDAFNEAHIQLQLINTAPYRHAVERQIDKQREDVRYVSNEGLDSDPQRHALQFASAIRLGGLIGPAAILDRREHVLIRRTTRSTLPDWIKSASDAQITAYSACLNRYDHARDVLSGMLNGAQSAEHYARTTLQNSLANDLGIDLSPDTIVLTTQRSLPDNLGHYTLTRTLTALALHGLHPRDERSDSEFATGTTITVDGQPASTAHTSLTPEYLARLINRLSLRNGYGEYRERLHARPANQRQMCEVLKLQIAEAIYAARMQGHIDASDLTLIERITCATASLPPGHSVQQISLNRLQALGHTLVFRKESPSGVLERLVLFTSHAPRSQKLQGFDDETRLLHELVSWTADTQMTDYLLNQVPGPEREQLAATLAGLSLKPFPEADFMQLTSLDSYERALQALLDQQLNVARAELDAHTPAWYRNASLSQRQQLTALEDTLQGALDHYQNQPHTAVEAFEKYVHRRASEKINQLLNTPEGTVDPDQVLIITPRETLTYTQMLRNGYDDSISLLTPTADTTASFKGPEGVDLSHLTPALVAGSVRGKWLADQYALLISTTLLAPTSTGYEYRRKASAVITQLQMQSAALRSLLKGHIDESRYQWLTPIIDALRHDDVESRGRYPVYPLQIHVDKPFIASRLKLIDQLVIADTNVTHLETVQGCFALISNESRLSALLYTPGAPDGIEFRLFSTFVESLNSSGMIDYYKDRCRLKARRLLSFFLNDMKNGNAHKAPFLPKASIQDFAHICFNRPLERKLRDVEETTTGRHDMLSRLIWNSIDVIATLVTLPFPPASFTVGVALSLRDNLKALQTLTGETPDEAGAFILASVLNIAGAAGDFTVGLKGFGGVARQLARDAKSRSLLTGAERTKGRPVRQTLHPVEIQDEPYLVARPDAQGRAQVYVNAGFEADDAFATGQYAVRNAAGQWQPLEPAITSTATAPTPVYANRAVDLPLSSLHPVTEGHAAGIYVGNGKCFITMNDLVYQVQYDPRARVWAIVDPANPFAFFGRQPVRLNDKGQWQLIARPALRGGADDVPGNYRPLPEEAAGSQTAGSSLHDYEVPKKLQHHLDVILGTDELDSLGPGFDEFFEAYYLQMRNIYTTLRANLYRDADAFFSASIPLPARPTLPEIHDSTTVGSFLENAFTHSNGLVFSEAPKSITSKRLLMRHMPKLAEQGVEVLYIQHLLTDKHLRKLAKYRAKGAKVRTGSHEIKHYLETVNGGALDNLSNEYDYYHLIKEAHRHNIDVRPFSASTSYPLDAHPVAAATEDATAAQKMSNYFGHKVISSDVEANANTRWVALLEHRLATTHDQIPGIAELEGAISIHVDDQVAGPMMRVTRNNDLTDHSDFKIKFLSEPPTRQPAMPDLRLDLDTVATTRNADLQNTESGFQWNDVSGWQRINPEHWTANTPPTALQQSLADAAYEIPLETRDTLYEMIYLQRRGMDTHYFFTDERLMSLQANFSELRSTLQTDARRVITVTLAKRPAMPSVIPQPDNATFIRRLYQETDGMVVGEFHSSIGSKKFIIEHMDLLVEENVKTLYMEHLLTDLHQADLDRFFETGQMSKRLLHALKVLDNGHLTDPAKVYTFEKLVLRARQHGIEIRAIDCAASYHLKGLAQTVSTTRQQMMNYFASRTIRRHQAVMGKHKWVALVGNSHANTFVESVPGIAELEGAIGVHVFDVPSGSAAGASVDTGENVRLPLSNREVFLKGDFRLDMEIPKNPIVIRPPQPLPLEQRLSRPGMFVTEQRGNVHTIIHRSRDQALHHTPVQINSAGKVYVDRPTWSAVHLQSYDDIDALLQALEDINLTRVA
ncbi:dermonecrotic toxin domain-containing protein [Pseudomonas sp. Pseu.R1]|uniref:dermonecrotic toxin domain-containing protein n=1 Tax=Pseudomonas sp. Pseu.R1 TaxID=3379818 RepID=UPI003B95F5CA